MFCLDHGTLSARNVAVELPWDGLRRHVRQPPERLDPRDDENPGPDTLHPEPWTLNEEPVEHHLAPRGSEHPGPCTLNMEPGTRNPEP